MNPLNLTPEDGKHISVIADPFIQDALQSITIRYNKSQFGGDDYWYARVEFKNGFSSGEQKTPNCKTYPEVMLHLQNILDSVKDKTKSNE